MLQFIHANALQSNRAKATTTGSKQGNNMTHTITHPQHAQDYFNGFESMTLKRKGMSFEACRDEFNNSYPIGHRPSSLAAYYYAKGEMQALQQYK